MTWNVWVCSFGVLVVLYLLYIDSHELCPMVVVVDLGTCVCHFCAVGEDDGEATEVLSCHTEPARELETWDAIEKLGLKMIKMQKRIGAMGSREISPLPRPVSEGNTCRNDPGVHRSTTLHFIGLLWTSFESAMGVEWCGCFGSPRTPQFMPPQEDLASHFLQRAPPSSRTEPCPFDRATLGAKSIPREDDADHV